MAGSRNESGSEFQPVKPMTESPGAKCAATKPGNIQFVMAGQLKMLAAGNCEDWHAAVG